VTLEPARVDEFRERFNAYAPPRLIRRISCRGWRLTPSSIWWRNHRSPPVEDVFALAPFGHGNQPPLFAARRRRSAAAPVVMKEKHLRIAVRQNGRSLTLKAGISPNAPANSPRARA